MLVAASALAVALPAHAVCGATPPIHVWPHRGVPAPINAAVFITMPSFRLTEETRFRLVTAPSKTQPATEIAGLHLLGWQTGELLRFELTQHWTRLQPSTQYEVWLNGEVLGV